MTRFEARRAALLVVGGLSMTVAFSKAEAAVDASVPITQVCSDVPPGDPVDYARFAAAVAAAAGVTPSDLNPNGRAMTPADYDAATLALLRDRKVPNRPTASGNLLMLIADLESLLAKNSSTPPDEAGLRVQDAEHGQNWLFRADRRTLTCAGNGPPTLGSTINKTAKRPRFALRGKVEDLGLVGKARKGADAFKLGYKRDIAEKDDGATKTVKTQTFDGVLGLRLSPDAAYAPIYLYGDYSLSRARTKPQPPLDPGVGIDDDDTNAWEVGLSTAGQLWSSAEDQQAVEIDARLGWVGDDIKGSRRAVAGLGFTPGLIVPGAKPCDIGAFSNKSLGSLKFRVRCRVRVEVEASYVDEVGKADFKQYGKFLAVGPTVGLDIAPPMGDEAGVITSLTYRWLPTISGRAPDVHRFDATVKYRFWLPNDLGLDLGVTYGKGRETKTYKDEDKVEIGIGVLF